LFGVWIPEFSVELENTFRRKLLANE